MPISNRQISGFIWPAIIANLSAPLLSLGDTAIVGHFGTTLDLSAMGAGAASLSMVIWLFGFLRMGTTGEVARTTGANNISSTSKIVLTGAGMALLLGISIGGSLFFAADYLANMINPDNASSVLTADYIHLRSLGLPASLINMVVIGWLIGIGKPKLSLMIVISSNLINLILSYLTVAVFSLGAGGVALSTVFAEYVALLIGMIIFFQRQPIVSFAVDQQLLVKFFQQNLNLFIRSAFLISGMTFFTAQSARLGDVALATNTILLNLLLVVSYCMDGVAHAVESLSGKAIGANNHAGFLTILQKTSVWALWFGVGFSTIFATFGNDIAQLFSQDLAVLKEFAKYTLWLAIMPIISVWAYYFDGVFIGADKIIAMRDSVAVACLTYMLLWLLLKQLGFGNHGLWFCFVLMHFMRGISLAGYSYYYWFKKPLELKK